MTRQGPMNIKKKHNLMWEFSSYIMKITLLPYKIAHTHMNRSKYPKRELNHLTLT